MNRSDETLFEPRIADWLEDDPHAAPDQALDVVLAAFPSIKQRRASRVPWRYFDMSIPLKLASAAAIAIAVLGGMLLFGRPSAGPSVGGGPTPTSSPSASPSVSAPTAPSPTQPPASFTSPLYGYTISWPPGGGWDVTPGTVPWREGTSPNDTSVDWFLGPAGAYADFDNVAVAAQPVPEGTTPDAWLLDYAERVAASGRDCKGSVDAWTDATIGPLTIRRLDLVCQEIRVSDVAFVIDGTGYVMSGNREAIALFLETFQPGA
jgi:hypothetical protein